jgi:hypothetical protein
MAQTLCPLPCLAPPSTPQQALFVLVLFLHNHTSMSYVHLAASPLFPAPPGWLQSTSLTSVRAVTLQNGAGQPIAGAALTATVTTTTTTATAAAHGGAVEQGGPRGSEAAAPAGKGGAGAAAARAPSHALPPAALDNVLVGHLSQHSETHAAQLAAAAAAAVLPAATDDVIELHPQRVHALAPRATTGAALQRLVQQGDERGKGKGGGAVSAVGTPAAGAAAIQHLDGTSSSASSMANSTL